MCGWHHYTQTNTNNVNKTCALLLTTGGKDEPNTVYMRKYTSMWQRFIWPYHFGSESEYWKQF